MMWHPG